jgi:hypothetical protein
MCYNNNGVSYAVLHGADSGTILELSIRRTLRRPRSRTCGWPLRPHHRHRSPCVRRHAGRCGARGPGRELRTRIRTPPGVTARHTRRAGPVHAWRGRDGLVGHVSQRTADVRVQARSRASRRVRQPARSTAGGVLSRADDAHSPSGHGSPARRRVARAVTRRRHDPTAAPREHRWRSRRRRLEHAHAPAANGARLPRRPSHYHRGFRRRRPSAR